MSYGYTKSAEYWALCHEPKSEYELKVGSYVLRGSEGDYDLVDSLDAASVIEALRGDLKLTTPSGKLVKFSLEGDTFRVESVKSPKGTLTPFESRVLAGMKPIVNEAMFAGI